MELDLKIILGVVLDLWKIKERRLQDMRHCFRLHTKGIISFLHMNHIIVGDSKELVLLCVDFIGFISLILYFFQKIYG